MKDTLSGIIASSEANCLDRSQRRDAAPKSTAFLRKGEVFMKGTITLIR